MNDIERIPQFRDIRGRIGIKIGERKLDDWRRINYSAITLTKATSSGGQRLLANGKLVAGRAIVQSAVVTER